MWSIGWGKAEIVLPLQGWAMHGYGQPTHRAHRQRTALWARAFCLSHAESGDRLMICCLDTGYVTAMMRSHLIERWRQRQGEDFDASRLLLTCTHTHSGPGGCAHEVLYNLVTPGFVATHLTAIVSAAEQALVQAQARMSPAELWSGQSGFDNDTEVAWNRSLAAYRRNPETPAYRDDQAHLALDRRMRTLAVRQEGQLVALMALFGVHATCLGNSLDAYDGDNKGYAAAELEEVLGGDAVALFAQGSAGDVSPHYHGPGQWRRRQNLHDEKAEVHYARRNGHLQAQAAMAACAEASASLSGPVDAVLSWVDFSQLKVSERYAGRASACTSPAALGISFIAGTPVDGRGISPALAALLRPLARMARWRRRRKDATGTPRVDAAQGVKDIFIDAGERRVLGLAIERLGSWARLDPLAAELHREVEAGEVIGRALLPSVLPLQIVRLGTLAWVCAPGEFTTIAGQRLLETLRPELARCGIQDLWLCTYCNEYMGYVTTYEEYQEQAYEGGHNVFGQWTLAAFQEHFVALARQLALPAGERNHANAVPAAPS